MRNGLASLIGFNANASAIVAAAGKISTTQGSADEIYEITCASEDEKNIKLINKILSSGHESVLEHVFLNLSFNNVSVFVEQFMIEFRLASFTVKSRRYVDFGKMGYVVPDFNGNSDLLQTYQKHMDYLFQEYEFFIQSGVPKEDARFILPYSFRSNFYCTVNAREYVKIVNEMVFGRGKKYPELVMLGKSLMEQCEKEFPYLDIKKTYSDNDETIHENLGFEIKKNNQADHQEFISIINGTTEPEKMICKAASLFCGAPDFPDVEINDEEKQKNIIKEVLKKSRRRELEQVYYTILFQKISLAGVTHLVRHRMQSIIIPDYLKVYDFNKYVMPESIIQAGLRERYTDVFFRTGEVADKLQKAGMNDCDMVYMLLSGMTVPVMTTMNANELLTFIRLRTCNRAQWEIKNCADELLKLLRQKNPVLFSMYGPTCYLTGRCPEGKMSCGQKEEVCRRYNPKEE